MRALFASLVVMMLILPLAASAQDKDPAPVSPALLVIDIQNAFFPYMDQTEKDRALQGINSAIWLFRKYERPVIRVYHTDPEWGPDPASADFQFPESVIVQESDPKVVKHKPSAFAGTELDAILKEKGIDTVFLCGLSATGCVLATYFGATERDYAAFMVEDALLSPKARHTEAIQDILDSASWTTMETILKAAAAPRGEDPRRH